MEINPIAGSVFFGRREECALFEKRFEAFLKGYRQNIGIIGPPFIGKTSLLRQFVKQISNSGVITFFYSCHEHDSFPRFTDRWMGEILVGVYRSLYKKNPVNFSELLSMNKKIIPKTLRRMRDIKKMVLKHRTDQAYREMLSLSGTVHEETGKKILFIVDEFDRLAEMGINDPFSLFGQEIMIQKETMFVVASSQKKYSQSIFQSKLSLLFGNFEVIELESFDYDNAITLVKNMTQVDLSGEELSFLFRITDGHPLYLNLLAKRIQFIGSRSQLVNKDLMIEAIAEEIFNDSGSLYHHFHNILERLGNGKPWQFYADCLTGIAVGNKKFSQLAKFTHQKMSDVKRAIERFISLEIIEKYGGLFTIPDPLFRLWLANVFYGKRFMYIFDKTLERQKFIEKNKEIYADYIQEDKKELPKRIEELFARFEDDVFEMGERKFKCPHFNEIISRPNNGRVFPVYAKNGKARWLCQVLSGKITEDDVNVFLEDLKQLKTPVQKRLIFGLNGIDLNAKLLAQEAKIQYFDLKNLNFLMDLYNKPKLLMEKSDKR